MKRVTINDVAKQAGVSKSTVSHVINNTRFVENETRQKVLHAIEALGYRPSSVARSLVSRKTRTAAILVSDVGNPFYSEVIHGVEEVALANGYDIFLCNTNYDLQRGMKFIHSLIDKLVDGVLFMSSSMSIELVQELKNNQIPAVVLDWETDKVTGKAAAITIEFSAGIHQAVHHLVQLGHTRIAHISGPQNLWTAQKRRTDFLNALHGHGLDSPDGLIVEGNLRIDGGREAFRQLCEEDQKPTAVFAANDLTALGILWSARECGMQVPQDLSIIGLDNIDLASKVAPPLTTVALPRFEIGSLAMTMLLDLIHGDQQTCSEVLGISRKVSTHLVVRESTASPP